MCQMLVFSQHSIWSFYAGICQGNSAFLPQGCHSKPKGFMKSGFEVQCQHIPASGSFCERLCIFVGLQPISSISKGETPKKSGVNYILPSLIDPKALSPNLGLQNHDVSSIAWLFFFSVWHLYCVAHSCQTSFTSFPQDILPLIEDLNNAGIRFVYFSAENELRSRVRLSLWLSTQLKLLFDAIKMSIWSFHVLEWCPSAFRLSITFALELH